MAKKLANEMAHGTFLALFAISFCFHASQGENEIENLLLSFKSSITHDPLGVLSNWNLGTPLCNWRGITCMKNNNSYPFVTAIDISGKNLTGNLHATSFNNLHYTETINLSNNHLSGQVPSGIFSCSSLRYINLSNNNLTGSIPRDTIIHGQLETLDLSNNILSGEIPDKLGLFSGLRYLDLGGNVLMGKIPRSLLNMTSLEYLTLASNQLVGEIPRELGQVKSLKWIYLGYNNLTGEIPKEIGQLTSLNHLDLVYNNLKGEIPSSLGNLSNLHYLFLYQNELFGPIPRSIFDLKKLVSLDLSDNYLSGEISELVIQLQNLEVLHLFSNSFTGKVPQALGSLPRLQVLQLWSNRLTGEIPENLGKQNNLTVLDLSTNFLTGKIPENLCQSGRLFKLILFSNFLQGNIPLSLSHCKSLGRVRLQNSGLSGQLPIEFTKLPLVYYLDVSGNNLSGTINERIWDMPSLQMLNLASNGFSGKLPISFGSDKLENLDLSANYFVGTIPPSFGNFEDLMQLKLSKNKLSGKIPQELSLCKKLVSLDLSQNQLSNQIPPSLSEMPVLGHLDLSRNELSGKIPPNLGKIQSLVQVNISYNHLHGALPSTGAFLAINSSAIAGNNLCGGDKTTELPRCKGILNSTWLYLVICLIVSLVVMALIALFVVVFTKRKTILKLQRVENEDGMWEMQMLDSKVWNSITINDILSSNKEESVRDCSDNGIHTRKSKSNGMQFVMRELNDINSFSSANFLPQMARISKIKHRNVVQIIGVCRSEKGECVVIYEFIEGKKLSEALSSLSWERRKKIAMGIAKVLRFLHCYCSPSALVGDLSPEKVFVDGEDEPHLRLCLPGMVGLDAKSIMSSVYISPEAKESKQISEKSDIYGFGLILIELLTGRTPADAEFGLNKSIVEWARYCYSDCHLYTWIDPMVREEASSDYQNGMVEIMNLALLCTSCDPSARPLAGDVYKTLKSLTKKSSR